MKGLVCLSKIGKIKEIIAATPSIRLDGPHHVNLSSGASTGSAPRVNLLTFSFLKKKINKKNSRTSECSCSLLFGNFPYFFA
ncbi:MAG: hypothetical protein ACK5AY_07580 [Bacteroidota bacterium]|jgi:hypothetical protein